MKTSKVSLGILTLAALVRPAAAGVVITQEETRPNQPAEARTVMIEGNKQKSTGGRGAVIIDLDAGKSIMVDDQRKTATEMSIEPKGPNGGMLQGMMSSMIGNFKSTGKKQTVAGYACDEYTNSGTMMMSEYTSVSCFSKDAPGAAEFGAFYRNMMQKMGVKSSGEMPQGVMLSHEMTMKTTMGAMPNLPPDVQKKMAEAMAKQGPQTFKTVVKTIKIDAVPATAFAIPAGYEKKTVDMGMMMGGPKGGAGPGGAAPPKGPHAPSTAEPPADAD